MRPVIALIFHSAPPPGAGPLVRALADARRTLAEEQLDAFLDAGADDARLIEGEPDWLPFGRRLAAAVRYFEPRGAVVLGSGSIPLARPSELVRLVDAAAGPAGRALANNHYSADVVAVSRASDLTELPDLPADNALPRWLEERAGVAVADMRKRWRLAVDLDSPADLALLSVARALPKSLRASGVAIELLAPEFVARLRSVAAVLSDRRAEIVLAGRLSAATLAALETESECRVRAFVEERGLKASSPLALSDAIGPARPPRSLLGERLDRDGAPVLGATLVELGDAAIVDTRVLLAHRLGADEAAWPPPEDRFASDLLAARLIADPWLRALTDAALEAPIPILLGGHSLLNGGLRMLSACAQKSRPRELRAARPDRQGGRAAARQAERELGRELERDPASVGEARRVGRLPEEPADTPA